jgi:serine/threonine-protein kinase
MIGTTLSHFNITTKLGEGGMGEVYRADDTKLGREVAIKVLPEILAADPERMARFGREAQVLASLNHPNIAAIYGLEEADGRHALVMELVEGETLAERIKRGSLPRLEAIKYALQIATALEEAHDHGIIHRDLKPANVVITPKGQVKVLDFGLAKALEDDPTASGSAPAMTHSPTLTAQMTAAGVLMGTAAYMSPEQARGEAADRRADIWSFGVVLMEMLTGKMVYPGKTVSDTLAGVLAREPEWDGLAADTPHTVRRLLERCLEKEANERLQAVGEARIALEHYLENPEAEEAAAVAAEAPPLWKRALPWAVAAASIAALAGTLLFSGSEPETATQSMKLKVEIGDQPLFVDHGASGRLSPDATHLVYVVDSGDNQQLHLRSLDQLEGSPMPGTEGAYNPFFSPDGAWIGFVTRNELKKVSVSGGTPLTLTELSLSRGASWADDDSIILAPSANSGLVRVSAAGGEPQPLTTLEEAAGEVTHRWPFALPDGRGVLFTSHNAAGNFDTANIEVLDSKSGERKVVHRGGSYPQYVPTGHLVYMNEGTLFAATFDLDTLETTSQPAPVLQSISSNPASTGGAQVSFSDNGTLAYLHGSATSLKHSIVWVNQEGHWSPVSDELDTFVEPRLSPDGRSLAVEILADQGSDAWVYDLDRGVSTKLTFDEAFDEVPIWSPDGQLILFSSDRDGVPNLYTKRADGSGQVERVTTSENPQYPTSWTSVGPTLPYTEFAPDNREDMWILKMDGTSEPEPYLQTPFGESEGVFSPDGRWIAYDSEESGQMEVYVRPFPSRGGKWQISVGGGSKARWARDGSAIFYRSAGGVSVAQVLVEGDAIRAQKPRQLFTDTFPPLTVGGISYADYDVDLKGERFLMFKPEGEQTSRDHLIFVTDWFSDL